jgi:hypothetical protein
VWVVGLAHQIQRATHDHVGLKRDPSMELVRNPRWTGI